jgi:hypothetical protein
MNAEELLGNLSEDGNEKPKAQQQSPLVSLEKDLAFYADSIKEIAIEIIAEGISEQPVFIAHQHEVSIGEVILNRAELNTNWTIQASTLAEFVEKGIIHPDKKAHFLKTYKNPQNYMCVFVIVPAGANFIYYPYPKA